MANKFEYKEKDLLGGWSIEVRKGEIPIGNIRKNPQNGALQYFHGINNILNYTFQENNLDVLKKIIEASY